MSAPFPFVQTPGPGGGVAGLNAAGSTGPSATKPTTYQWVLAWIMLILLLALAGQTETGYTIIYYALVLILVLLLVTQYQFIASALAPIGTKAPA